MDRQFPQQPNTTSSDRTRSFKYRIFKERRTTRILIESNIIQNLPDGFSKNGLALFADDVALFTQAKTSEEAESNLNPSLEEINQWAEKWKLRFAAASCLGSFVWNTARDTLTMNLAQLKVDVLL